MNLVEQLGGYEKAKDWVNQSIKSISQDVLNSELLQYRRQHNIFEVGDIITYNESNFVYRIDTRNSDGIHATTTHEVKRCIIAIFGHDHIRHATDEEIKAGKRLGVDSE